MGRSANKPSDSTEGRVSFTRRRFLALGSGAGAAAALVKVAGWDWVLGQAQAFAAAATTPIFQVSVIRPADLVNVTFLYRLGAVGVGPDEGELGQAGLSGGAASRPEPLRTALEREFRSDTVDSCGWGDRRAEPAGLPGALIGQLPALHPGRPAGLERSAPGGHQGSDREGEAGSGPAWGPVDSAGDPVEPDPLRIPPVAGPPARPRSRRTDGPRWHARLVPPSTV